ncbi:PAS domain-containing sensor histidine kinase [Fluviicola taffensis]|uniref:histidine kinase n=1 Tax=Fluviicola taffensis (strain DSM 16823 / NCIMB 13979 / RW262) TaxID=755732 RepID=F2IFL5_FLUTR|nr:PAS domain-containing sensor histidine kinase [Fluviicola taffensis]AEA45729.1 signal transduction histidine kinase [Fluviicola taffensis DSM 16823]
MKRSILNLSILDSLLEGFQVIDYNWKYLYVNQTVAVQGQSTTETLIGKTMMECYPGIENTTMFSQLKICMEERVTLQFENEFTYNNKTKNWFELRIEPIPEGIFVLSTNITNRKKAEKELLQLKNSLEKKVQKRTAELEKLNNEKDVILKEMHHRVKNNLQIISSLIRLQIDEGDNNFNGVLDKTQSRIETIASIHESLYKHKDLALINVANYWEKLINDCLNSLVNEPANFKLNLDIDYLEFPVDKMIPLALLINELVTNSILHGFKGQNHGSIYLSLRLKNDKYLLTYKDDGVGFKEVNQDENDHHLGHFLIEGFAEQLNGSIQRIDTEVGVHFELEFA